MKAISRQLRITPRKLNLIAGLVRNKDAGDAMSILQFTPKKGARLLYKVVKSAVANAENNFKQEKDSLYVKEIVVGKAMTIKRSVPISRGRMHPRLKRSSHVYVTIGVREGANKSEHAGKGNEKASAEPKGQLKKEAAKAAAPKTIKAKKPAKVTKVKA